MRTGMQAKARVKAKRRKKKRFRPFAFAFRTAIVLGLAGVGWIGYLLWSIYAFQPAPLKDKYDAGIVLGAALWRNEPTAVLRERLDHALKLYKQGKFDTFILTGGYDYNGSTIPEAEGMRDYLLARGVPQDRMLLDPEAQSTYDNLLNSKAIMKREGIASVVIITHEFHSARAADIARYLNYDRPAFSMAESRARPVREQSRREVMAFTKWKLDSLLLRFGTRLPDNKEMGL
ncbi:MAG TPA: YdcF family protein [Paenibacillus sp.]|uniref:SanA/YdcF family protein n=1 Tax=Paenibacillus sp. TaxID=58172 RepID=UPI002CC28E43|nr:YdcF family protein [Paenibacillus sp.]HUC90635.1 YdcF family protein [Paenibacillus sp.]